METACGVCIRFNLCTDNGVNYRPESAAAELPEAPGIYMYKFFFGICISGIDVYTKCSHAMVPAYA